MVIKLRMYRKELWCRNMGIANPVRLAFYSHICGMHFKIDQFKSRKKRLLKRTAVPTIKISNENFRSGQVPQDGRVPLPRGNSLPCSNVCEVVE